MPKSYDVIVCGGGLSGICAAIAASREGATVLLIEKYGFLGGAATNALVNPFMAYQTLETRVNNAGIFQTLLTRLEEMGGLFPNKHGFNEQILMILLDRMLQEAHVEVLLHAQLAEAQVQDGFIQSITALGMSGQRLTLMAKVYVDCTGDGELTHLSGCPYQVGRAEDGKCQPMTTCFRVGNIDFPRLEAHVATTEHPNWKGFITAVYQEKQRAGEITNPRENVLIFPHGMDDSLHFNTTRVLNHSSLDTENFTRAEQEGRRQVYEMYNFFKTCIPGFENSVLIMVAPQIGVRESRRLVGEHILTEDEVMACTKFDDAIARACYCIDVHNPAGTGTVIRHLPKGEYYTIPLRSLYNAAFPNLLVAGRPISSDHAAHSSLRVMPICASMGEAAGIAAALAGDKGVGAVCAKEVQKRLDQHGALH